MRVFVSAFPRTVFLAIVAVCLLVSTVRVVAQDAESASEPPAASQLNAAQTDAAQTDAAQTDAGKTGEARGEKILGDSGVFEYNADTDPEMIAEIERRYKKFKTLSSELGQALFEQRKNYLLYVNMEERTPQVKDAYFAARKTARDLFDQTFTAALELTRIAPEQESATFLATYIGNRNDHDIYNLETSEAASRLIDGGSNLLLLFKAAARGGVVGGEFELARKLLEAMDDEQLEDVDRSLLFHMDKHEETYKREMEIRQAEAERDDQPRVKLETTQGDVVIELFLDSAPSTVSHFIGLVEAGFYDGLDFHQVIDHLLALTGDPTGLGSGGSGKLLMDEHDRPDARAALRGSLIMAKIPDGDGGDFVPNTASSQFAILFLPIATAVDQQTVFGRVIEGMDNVGRMRRIDPSKEKKKDEIVIPADRILSATVIRRPDDLPTPQYLTRRQRN